MRKVGKLLNIVSPTALGLFGLNGRDLMILWVYDCPKMVLTTELIMIEAHYVDKLLAVSPLARTREVLLFYANLRHSKST